MGAYPVTTKTRLPVQMVHVVCATCGKRQPAPKNAAWPVGCNYCPNQNYAAPLWWWREQGAMRTRQK